ncbi:MAG: DUF4421 domain-containing protein [Bacteroidales bacterium]
MQKLIFVSILLVSLSTLQAQENKTGEKKKFTYDTTLIVDLTDKPDLYFNVTGKINHVDIGSEASDNSLKIRPNGNTVLGFGIDTKWIGLSASFSLPFMNKDEDIYGKTESFDIQVNYYGNSFGVDAWARHYKGFYLDNPEDFVNWPNDNYPLLSGMETYGLGLSGYYFFNHKTFSYKAAFPRTMFQKKSSGSFVVGGFASRGVADMPDGVIPPQLPDSLNDDFDIRGFSNSMVGLTFGYTYTWVFAKNFFVNVSLVPGVGYVWPEVQKSLDNVVYDPSVSLQLTTRLALGYEGRHFYAGFNIVAIADNFAYENIDVSSASGNLRLFIGKRFDVKNWFKKK